MDHHHHESCHESWHEGCLHEDCHEDNRYEEDENFLDDRGFEGIDSRCSCCNECLPCPAGIDIAMVNMLYELAIMHDEVPEGVREQYFSLEATAGDCLCCGDCETRCPADMPIVARMAQAAETFDE